MRTASGLFDNAAIAAVFASDAAIGRMIAVERALARAQGRQGAIPAEAAAAIDRALTGLAVDQTALEHASIAAGLPVPALVAALRETIGPPHGEWVHRGATSQDIMDTALVLGLRDALGLIAAELDQAIARLADAAERHADTVMAARTRSQIATPTTLGLRIAGWLGPLVRCRRRLAQLRPRVLVVQLGGASGTMAALGPDALALIEALAAELGLDAPVKPWHAERDGIAELASWLALVTGCAGRIGADLVLLGRSESAEVRAGAGGGSSTMPQKANPVRAEALVTLARETPGLLATMHQALVHTEERDGAAWALEWLTLPRMLEATAAAIGHVTTLAAEIEADPARMRAILESGGGAALAEAAAFALARHIPLPEAQALVKRAARSGRPLIEALKEQTSAALDWTALADPARQTGRAAELVARAVADARR